MKRKLSSFTQTDDQLALPLDVWKSIFRLIPRDDWISVLCINKQLSSVAKEVFIQEELSQDDEQSSVGSILNALAKFMDRGIPDATFIVEQEIPIFPYIEIAGVELTFPVVESTCKQLIERSEVTPFGKGMDTLVDSTIRSGWQIDASKITFHTTEWEKLFSNSRKSTLLGYVKENLVPCGSHIRAELYKFLIYGKGDKFKPHKDTIRGKNHFGSLVVFLPSTYTGGDFVVKHQSMSRTFNYSLSNPDIKSSPMKIHCVAFFTDCEHEVMEVESGYRAALTYNLYLDCDDDDNDDGERPWDVPIFFDKALYQGKLKKCWSAISALDSKKRALGFLLEHCYSEETLEPDQLKGRDFMLYQFLISLGLSWEISLEPVTVSAYGDMVGEAECRKHRDNDDSCSDVELGEVCFKDVVDNLTIDVSSQRRWSSFRGESITFKDDPDGETSGEIAFAVDWSSRNVENAVRHYEITGNVGCHSHHLMYTTAALLLFPLGESSESQ